MAIGIDGGWGRLNWIMIGFLVHTPGCREFASTGLVPVGGVALRAFERRRGLAREPAVVAALTGK